MKRTRITPETQVPVPMTERDRTLLLDHTLAEPEYAMRLLPEADGNGLVGKFTLDDLEDLIGYIAAEANHTKNKKIVRELDDLCERLYEIQRSYDDGNFADSEP
ncbi:MAG: hypothetical protein M9921_05665 [Fimbriimonadaceae bacterium]|nr:hypothetical protein [Fimbriimonadaceae bacterium]